MDCPHSISSLEEQAAQIRALDAEVNEQRELRRRVAVVGGDHHVALRSGMSSSADGFKVVGVRDRPASTGGLSEFEMVGAPMVSTMPQRHFRNWSAHHAALAEAQALRTARNRVKNKLARKARRK